MGISWGHTRSNKCKQAPPCKYKPTKIKWAQIEMPWKTSRLWYIRISLDLDHIPPAPLWLSWNSSPCQQICYPHCSWCEYKSHSTIQPTVSFATKIGHHLSPKYKPTSSTPTLPHILHLTLQSHAIRVYVACILHFATDSNWNHWWVSRLLCMIPPQACW